MSLKRLTIAICFTGSILSNESLSEEVKCCGELGQAGSSSRINQTTVLRAIAMIKQGKVADLGFTHAPGMPANGDRQLKVISQGTPNGGPGGKHNIVWNSEYIAGELGHIGTQFDTLAHIGKRMTSDSKQDKYYGGISGNELYGANGVQRLGAEHIQPFVTKAVLIDIAGYKQQAKLKPGYEVTMADVKGAIQKQGINADDIMPGDAVFFNYGWWRYWPNAQQVKQKRPGINQEVALWLAALKPSLVGSDNSTDLGGDHAVHYTLMVEHGILNLEFMNFSQLINDQQFQFALFYAPLKIKGASGVPARPIALY